MKPSTMKLGLVLLGVALGVLAVVAFQHLWPRLCPANGGPPKRENKHSSSDPPVGGQGGSFAFHGSGPWSVSGNNAYTDLTVNGNKVIPSVLYLDGVDPNLNSNVPQQISPGIPLAGNWSIVLDYRDHQGKEDQNTTLSICPAVDATSSPLSCAAAGTATNTRIYLLSSPAGSGTFTPQTIDRGQNGTIFYDLNQCPKAPSGSHYLCDHPYKVIVNPGSGVSTPYKCVDGACLIWISNQ
jgi:hypothetical protein